MLTVDHYELIRRKYFIDGMSGRAIAEQLRHSRKTVVKALAHPIAPGYRMSRPRAKPVIDPVASIIDAWLEQDRSERRKQRHTAQRIYERLRDEHGFEGDASTVRRYVASVKDRGKEVFMPLAFEPGEEAQVDWHEGWIIENGIERSAQFFCMKLCYSKATFVWPYERANLESFLDGHVRAFEYFGGVPWRIAYDNLKCAVIQIKHGGERRLNRRFKELRSWYLFDTRFCNVARGNEKGDVENLAKRSERTYLTPKPQVGALSQLGSKLRADCQRDLNLPAPPPHHGQTRGELFEQERRVLRALPEHRFEAYQEQSTFIDKQALVHFETNRYSAPVRWAHHPVLVRAYVDRVELWCEHACVAMHERCYAKQQYRLTPEHYLPLLRIKPGSLDNARPFKGMPWGEDFALLRKELEYRHEAEGTRRYVDVLLLFTQWPEPAVRDAVSRCVRRRAFAYEAVVGVLRNEPPRPRSRLDLSDRPALVTVGDGIRAPGLYDQLRLAQEVAA